MRTIDEDLQAAVAYHGHLCSGMILGVRMARLGLRELGIDDPLNYRDLIVYVEMDRCATDAVGVVTGCTPGRRRLKIVDYGKMAASFVDLASGRAVRVAAWGSQRPPEGADPPIFWKDMPDAEIFKWQPVRVDIPPEDLPGKPRRTVTCSRCGERIHDCRELVVDGGVLCRACARGAYYQMAEPI
ncbi:FmdE family protein [Moorella sp. Hama-1]|uniref:FmdE family protein n=1 Tax=Moorella sp. Hama-1 TaxID=2138101 RepID=UPI000D643F74|nr:FmdE family protein [Moorella sp. Hama-1]